MGKHRTPQERDAIFVKVTDLMASGSSLSEACRKAGVPLTTVLLWADRYEGNYEQYARAQAELIEYRRAELLRIADECEQDGVAVQKAKLRIDTRKWELSKIMPKRFGDRTSTEISGPNGGPIESVSQITRVIVDHAATNKD
jgi:transposase